MESDVHKLKQGYRLLGVPETASVYVIKQAHRRLLKRWHPDLYANGTQEHTDATVMAKKINEAYAAVAGAPLRYYVEPSIAAPPQRAPTGRDRERSGSYDVDNFPRLDRIEFWVRFLCGGLFGITASVDLAVQLDDMAPKSFIVVAAILTLSCAFASARLGDRFWRSLFGRWWTWS